MNPDPPLPEKEPTVQTFPTGMYVVKRDGRLEEMAFDKITVRLNGLMNGLDRMHIHPTLVTQRITQDVKPGMTTQSIDELAAEQATALQTSHPHYGILAARILVSALHKRTSSKFSETMEKVNDSSSGSSYLSPAFMTKIRKYGHILDSHIDYTLDYHYDIFAFRTICKMYLNKNEFGDIIERPQDVLMRVAVCLCDTVPGILDTYAVLSKKHCVHATPTLSSSGKRNGQLCSCFLLGIDNDSMESIADAWKNCALISKSSGGIGINISGVRATGSMIKSCRGTSNGLIPMCRVFNGIAKYVDQGGRRPGGIAMYLEPWHADLLPFLEIRNNNGTDDERCRDLFTALWVSDLFMERVESDSEWSFFSPDTAPGLIKVWGQEFNDLYTRYEKEGRALSKMPARAVMDKIADALQETGTPYVLFKDSCNRKSNQQNLGTIQCSNLCAEILEFTSEEEIACCNLGSLNLATFVIDGRFDFALLESVTRIAVRNLNRVIDVTTYPLSQNKTSNTRHRPIGLGVQGLADAFILMRMPFDSPEARNLNVMIFETMYWAAMNTSLTLAKEEGKYSSFDGSPLSKGLFQFDLWGVQPQSGRYDWESLRTEVVTHGVRNSLLIALMPTATTSQINGVSESFEPITSNMFLRATNCGTHPVVNAHLIKDLQSLGLWSPEMSQEIVANRGSIQTITRIPPEIRLLYRTVREIPLKAQLEMAADRGPYICQTQSMNHYPGAKGCSRASITKALYCAWGLGLKTGIYYQRNRPAMNAAAVTVEMVSQSGKMTAVSSDGSQVCNRLDKTCTSCHA
jgi:ribonucleoside-diphosphate reductase alpha subunit